MRLFYPSRFPFSTTFSSIRYGRLRWQPTVNSLKYIRSRLFTSLCWRMREGQNVCGHQHTDNNVNKDMFDAVSNIASYTHGSIVKDKIMLERPLGQLVKSFSFEVFQVRSGLPVQDCSRVIQSKHCPQKSARTAVHVCCQCLMQHCRQTYSIQSPNFLQQVFPVNYFCCTRHKYYSITQYTCWQTTNKRYSYEDLLGGAKYRIFCKTDNVCKFEIEIKPL